MNAHVEVAAAVRAGELVRQSCEECGRRDAVAHHDDYTKPLDVRWLCHRHHAVWHRDNLAENLAELRAARDRVPYTQTELADLLGVSHRTVQNWEYGVTPQPRHRRLIEGFLLEQAA